MGNQIYVSYLKVLQLEDDGTARQGRHAESFGYRIYDDAEEHTDSGYETFKELQAVFRRETIVAYLQEVFDSGMADFALERGLVFNGDWISGEKLKKIQEPNEDEEDDDG